MAAATDVQAAAATAIAGGVDAEVDRVAVREVTVVATLAAVAVDAEEDKNDT